MFWLFGVPKVGVLANKKSDFMPMQIGPAFRPGAALLLHLELLCRSYRYCFAAALPALWLPPCLGYIADIITAFVCIVAVHNRETTDLPQ
jgi:hypothetical protein